MPGADNAMTRNDYGQWIAGASGADGPGTGIEGLGDLSVGRGGAIRNAWKMPPNPLLESSAGGANGKVENSKCAVEIGVELCPGVFQKGGGGIIDSPAPVDGDKGVVSLKNREIADGSAER